MRKPVSELSGPELDLWTARAAGIGHFTRTTNGTLARVYRASGDGGPYEPSAYWHEAGALMNAYKINILYDYGGQPVTAFQGLDLTRAVFSFGDTPMQAVCRAVVQSVFGLTVDTTHGEKDFSTESDNLPS